MTDQGKSVLQLPVKTSLASANDKIVFVYNSSNTAAAQTALITADNLIRSVTDAEIHTIQTNPANSNSLTIEMGTLFFSNGFLYFADADNHVKRVALSSF